MSGPATGFALDLPRVVAVARSSTGPIAHPGLRPAGTTTGDASCAGRSGCARSRRHTRTAVNVASDNTIISANATSGPAGGAATGPRDAEKFGHARLAGGAPT